MVGVRAGESLSLSLSLSSLLDVYNYPHSIYSRLNEGKTKLLFCTMTRKTVPHSYIIIDNSIYVCVCVCVCVCARVCILAL